MLFTGEIDSEFVSKHEFGNECLPSTSDPYFEFTITKFSFTSTGRDFDSMYSESFSFASTAKSVTRWLNYLPQRAEVLTH